MATRGNASDRHLPVLRERVVELLGPALSEPGAVYVDATLGMGGHALAVLEAFPDARVVGLDRDAEALDLAGERLAAHADRLTLVHAVYDEFAAVIDSLRLRTVDATLFDLGVSSLQLDEEDRGFAYRVDAPLDMRMDQSHGVTAAEVVNTYEAADLERILKDYGEERFAKRIAGAIVRERAALPAAIAALRVGGRIAVLSYHSLEDRITKRALALGATSSAPVGLPVELPEHTAYLKLLTRGAEEPSAAEVATNPRAASVRLRAAERIRRTKGPAR